MRFLLLGLISFGLLWSSAEAISPPFSTFEGPWILQAEEGNEESIIYFSAQNISLITREFLMYGRFEVKEVQELNPQFIRYFVEAEINLSVQYGVEPRIHPPQLSKVTWEIQDGVHRFCATEPGAKNPKWPKLDAVSTAKLACFKALRPSISKENYLLPRRCFQSCIDQNRTRAVHPDLIKQDCLRSCNLDNITIQSIKSPAKRNSKSP